MNEQALKERLKSIAKVQGKTFQAVWKLLLLERFLVRLSHSKFKNKFIFKGGLLLTYYLTINRETMDIDFLARQLQAEKNQIKAIMTTICDTPIEDGFDMSFHNIKILDHSHMHYPGYRIKIDVAFEKMKDRIQIDIGIGDVVSPKEIAWPLYQYKGKSLFENVISLQSYPVETIFSEKLEAIVSRGATNSRMKDFHDIVLLCRKEKLFDMKQLKLNIEETFRHRSTKMNLPIKFSESDYSRLQPLWSRHLRTLSNATRKTLHMPDKLEHLVDEVNVWLKRAL